MELQMADWSHDTNASNDASLDPENLFQTGSPSLEDIYGTPEVHPRVGEEYQADIPTMMTERDYLQSRQAWCIMENRSDVDDFLCTRISVPLMWVHDKFDDTKCVPFGCAEGSLHYEDSKGCKGHIRGSSTFNGMSGNGPYLFPDLKTCSSGTFPKFMYEDSELKTESLDHPANISRQAPSSHAVKSMTEQIGNQMVCNKNSYLDQKSEGKCFINLHSVDLSNWHLVPGALGETWTELEHKTFLLGLYIFGKNLVQVKRFMESKHMGGILSFYYGSFFRSDAHRRWSNCHKIRSKRSIHGHRIFHGLRQQELLSRLMPHTSEESKNSLLENTRAYNEGKMSLEEYVTMLKITVGFATLVEAVGIGKGKQDLTGIIAEPAKTNQSTVARSEIPIGKACSSLTSEEIVKFLTGDFRLSKARSNDLFWEAVWPRLLARGWHSEQPKNHGYVGSKNSLVFLIPGIKKFSRRKLVKGTHYFDSLSDVLNKVALDPSLLVIEADGTKGSGVKEEIWDADAKDEKGVSDHHRHCYLRPRLSNFTLEHVKFTVVDTSMVYEEPHKVRDMRTLPMDSGTQSPANLSTDTDNDSSEGLADESDAAGTSNDSKSPPAKCSENLEEGISGEMQLEPQNGQVTIFEQTSLKDEVGVARACTDNLESGPVPFTSKKKDHESFHMTESSTSKYLAPVPKRQRINPGNHGHNHQEDLLSTGSKVKEDELPSESKVNVPETATVDHSQGTGVLSTSIDGRHEAAVGDDCSDNRKSQEKGIFLCQGKSFPRTFIDLNLPFPHCPPDIEMDDAFDVHMAHYQDNPDLKGDPIPLEANQHTESIQAFEMSDSMVDAKESITHARRQSTRNRPLTIRALEALACGLLSTRRRARGTKSGAVESLAAKTSRRRKRDTEISELATSLASANGAGVAMGVEEEKMDEEGNINKIMNEVHSDKSESLGLIGLSKSSFQSEISTAKESRSG